MCTFPFSVARDVGAGTADPGVVVEAAVDAAIAFGIEVCVGTDVGERAVVV